MTTDPAYDLNRNVHRITLYNTIAADQQHTSRRPRLYLHIDMNCFYAQVEQLCYNLYGIPIIIGGWRKENGIARGIVATSSYEARKLGIKTGLVCSVGIAFSKTYAKLASDLHKPNGMTAERQLELFFQEDEKLLGMYTLHLRAPLAYPSFKNHS